MIFPYKIQALLNLVPNSSFSWGGEEWETLTWLDECPCPTKEEWETEKARLVSEQPLQDCKSKAQSLLNESDFTDLYSVRNKLENIYEWDTYREVIRELRINPIKNPVFPDKPKTIWKQIVIPEPIQEVIIPIEEPIINNEETII
jgi:hypothetical protein